MPKLSDIFQISSILRDANFKLTHYATSLNPGSVCFVLNKYYLQVANSNPNITAIITTHELAIGVLESKGLICDEIPKKKFFQLHNSLVSLYPQLLPVNSFVHPSAYIAASAQVGINTYVGEGVVIENGAIVNDYSHIGDYSYIGERSIIGARGMHNTIIVGRSEKVLDLGGVWIGEGCEVLAGAIIQKSYFREFTRIGGGTKVGPMASVGHGVIIGENCLIAGHSTIAGFSTIGNEVWIGPSAVIAHGLNVGNNANIKLGSVVVSSVQAEQTVSGNLALDHAKQLKNFSRLKKMK